jgi:CheY-like chemotaxis protein
VELYHQLTATGADDFDMSVTTRDSGTSFRMRFELLFVAPPPVSPAPNIKKQKTQLDQLSGSITPSLPSSLFSGTVLVVDDSMVIRKIISRYLHSFGCVHKVCCDGSEAWDWFVANHASCAGVITDLEMPKMGGELLIAKVQELCPGKPCFIVSGNDISPEKMPPGALRAIVKPVSVDLIESILREIATSSENSLDVL